MNTISANRAMRVRFQHPSLPKLDEVDKYFRAAHEQRWYSNGGPCVESLIQRLEDRLGRGLRTLPVASGTAALLVALRAAIDTYGCRGSGFVAVPSYTFAATVRAIDWCNLVPLFVDVDPEHWHLSPDALKGAFTRHGDDIAAVLACSTFGTPPPIPVVSSWESVCHDAGVPLIVDSAPGFGATDASGQALGHQGDVEIFSFHATKPFAIGEGGLIVSADSHLMELMQSLANFGFGAARIPTALSGINAKMSEIHAAIALAVLDNFDSIVYARRTSAERLLTAIHGADITPQANYAGSVWQFVPVLAKNEQHRREVIARATEQGVEIRTYHMPLHQTPAYTGAMMASELDVTVDLASRSLSLPMANDLTVGEIGVIADVVRQGKRR